MDAADTTAEKPVERMKAHRVNTVPIQPRLFNKKSVVDDDFVRSALNHVLLGNILPSLDSPSSSELVLGSKNKRPATSPVNVSRSRHDSSHRRHMPVPNKANREAEVNQLLLTVQGLSKTGVDRLYNGE